MRISSAAHDGRGSQGGRSTDRRKLPSCKHDDFCEECREDIEFFQEQYDFDVTEYISKSVPEDLKTESGESPE